MVEETALSEQKLRKSLARRNLWVLSTRIQKYQDDASKSLQDKQIELQKPLTEKALAAIQKVARAKGVQYVLDSTLGSGVLLADGMDLLADVKKELGF